MAIDSKTGTKVLGYLLFVLLGMAPQLLQNAIFAETPMFCNTLPEGQKISSFIVAAFMFANIVTIIYFIVQNIHPLPDVMSISVIIVVSGWASLLVAFFWSDTFHGISLSLLAMSFIAAAMGNTSVLVFFAFASSFYPIFTSALSVGYSLSGALAFLIYLAQNYFAESPRFSSETYFLISFCALVLFSSSFVVILMMKAKFGDTFSPDINDDEYAGEDEYEEYRQTANASDEDPENEFGGESIVLKDSSSNFVINSPLLDPEVPSIPTPEGDPIDGYSITYSLNFTGENFVRNHDSNSEDEDPERTLLLNLDPSSSSRRRLYLLFLRQVCPTQAQMLLISLMTFMIPAAIPFMAKGNDTWYMWLNGEFLVIPSIGAAITGFQALQKPRLLSFFVLLQFVLFVMTIVPLLEVFTDFFNLPPGYYVFTMAFFTLLCGFNSTMIYLKIRWEFTSGRVYVASVSRLCRLAGFLTQIGGLLAALFNILLMSLGAYAGDTIVASCS